MTEMRCPNCGKVGGRHFAPPSLGEPGFYTCGGNASTVVPSPAARDGETLSDELIAAWRTESSTAYGLWDTQIRLDARVVALCDTVVALRAECARLTADKERLDWLGGWTGGDQTICPPGNHGGGADNWLIGREDDARTAYYRYGPWCDEYEGLTLRAAIDAARAAAPTPGDGETPP